MNVELTGKLLLRGALCALLLSRPQYSNTYYSSSSPAAMQASHGSVETQITPTDTLAVPPQVVSRRSPTLMQRALAMLHSLGAGIKKVFSSRKKELTTKEESLEIINDLLEVIYALDLDEYEVWEEQLSQFKVYVNGTHVPHEMELQESGQIAVKVPHTPQEPCTVSFVAPMSVALEMLEHPEFHEHKEQVQANIKEIIESSRIALWLQSFFTNQQEFVLFASKYLKMQVAFHYTLDAQDLTQNGQLYILTVVASKQWEWENRQPDFTAQAKSLRTVEVIIHDGNAKL